jgi:hypothetical protein
LMGAEDCTGSTSNAAQMLDKALEPKGSDSGWWACQRWYSVRRSKVRECCRYGGSTTALSRASRGNCTRRSHESNVTKANSRFLGNRCSWANVSKRLIASRNVPALRTWSQVRVVRLAAGRGQVEGQKGERGEGGDSLQSAVMGVLTGLTKTLSLWSCIDHVRGETAASGGWCSSPLRTTWRRAGSTRAR